MSANAPTVMTADERRKVFWLLKKYSSYTAWRVLAEAYYVFADAWMVAMRKADMDDIDDFNQGASKDILSGRIAFEKGLARLKKGDRHVWREGQDRSYAAWGPLAQASYQIDFIRKIMDPQEYIFDWMKNKDDVVAAAASLEDVRYGQESILERLDENVAPTSPWNALATFHPVYQLPMNDPKHLNFPVVLPEIPQPTPITVQTGDEVPVDGIYEPEWGAVAPAANEGLFGKLKSAFATRPPSLSDEPRTVANWRREHIGCLNYLIANTTAPTYRDEERDVPWPVTWRLIWKDERYLDGVVPPEEVEYLAPVAPPQRDVLRCPAGQPCPQSGYWSTPATLNSRRLFQAGDLMPDLDSAYGQTIWQWDEQQ